MQKKQFRLAVDILTIGLCYYVVNTFLRSLGTFVNACFKSIPALYIAFKIFIKERPTIFRQNIMYGMLLCGFGDYCIQMEEQHGN